MYKVVKLIQTCTACPSQWEGKTDDGKSVYIRYRWGQLTVNVDNEPQFHYSAADVLDGFMTFDEMAAYTRSVLVFDLNGEQPRDSSYD